MNLELARRSPFFAAAGEAAMLRLLRGSFTQQLPRGSTLFDQYETPAFVHLLLEGSIGLRARADGNDSTLVEIFTAGELFLAPAVLLELPYLASAVALTEIRVLMIQADSFRDGVEQDPALARATVELLSRHWRLLVDQVVDIKLRSAERRVARFLARRVPEDPGAGLVALPEPRTALAARLGMTPETLSRALASLEAQGLIRVSARHVDVLDRSRLAG
jgi:CRP/FNR family transcriptional activator FtrB